MKDIKTNWLFPVLALSQNQVLALRIKSCNVDLILGIPIPAQFGELERPCVIDIQFPHPLLTDFLIYEANVAGSEALADLIHHDTAMSTFDKAHIGIDTHDDKSLPGYDYINTGDINPQFMVYVNGSCAGLYYWSSRESQSADNGWRNVQLHNGDSVKMVRVAMPLFNKEDSSGLDSSVWNLLNASEEHYQSSVALIDMTAPGSAKVGDKATFSATVTGANTTNLGSGKSAAGITLFISAPSEAETLGQPIYKSAAVTGEDGSLQYVFTQPGWYTVAMFNVTPDKLTFTSVYNEVTLGEYYSLYGGDYAMVYPTKCTAKQKQQIGGVDGHAIDSNLHPLHQLQKRVLRSLTVGLTPVSTMGRQLVHLVNEDDGMPDVGMAFEACQQVSHNVRRIFSAIIGLGDAGGVHSEKRQPCDPGGLTDDGSLAAPTGAIQQQIGTGNKVVSVGAEHLLPDSQCHSGFCLFLPDNGLVHFLNDVLRRDGGGRYIFLFCFFGSLQNMEGHFETAPADHPAGRTHHVIIVKDVDEALVQGAAGNRRGLFLFTHVITHYSISG